MSEQVGNATKRETRYNPATPWRERGIRTKIAFWFALLWAIYMILTMCNVFFYLDILIFPLAHRALSAGVLITVCLLAYPAQKPRDYTRLPWYDTILILWVLASCVYVAVQAETLLNMWADAIPVEIVLFFGLYLGGIEAVRRSMGLAPALVSLGFFIYLVYSDYFPSFLMSSGFSYPEAVGWLYLSGEGFWGTIIAVSTTIVPGFILFGSILQATGASDFFNNLALAALGRYRGGPAKTAVFGSALMGMISGIAAANVATVGVITIPLMKKNGFKPITAAAIEAVASSGGMFTPPIMGAVAFLIAQFLGIPYWQVCMGALIPAGLFYVILFYQIDIESARMNLKGLPRKDLPRVWSVIKQGWYYLLPIAVLIFCLSYLRYSTETTILYTLAVLIVCTSFSKRTRLTKDRLIFALEETGRTMSGLVAMCMIIGVVVCSMTVSGTGAAFSTMLTTLAGDNIYLLLFMAAIASMILGMGMPALGCYLITVTLMAPAMTDMGVMPLAAHMFLFFYGCLCNFTPPVAIASFVAAGIAETNANATSVEAMRFGIAGYLVPWVFVFKPELLFIGSFGYILFELACAFVGMAFLVSGIRAYFMAPLNYFNRLLCILLGLANVVPFPKAYEMPILVASIVYFGFLYIQYRKRHRAPAVAVP